MFVFKFAWKTACWAFLQQADPGKLAAIEADGMRAFELSAIVEVVFRQADGAGFVLLSPSSCGSVLHED